MRISPLLLLVSVSLSLLTSISLILVADTARAATYAAGVKTGNLNNSAMAEISGLVVSRTNNDVLWVHNDSGDSARLFAMNTTGKILGTYNMTGAVNTDWEDIAIGRGPVAGVDYIYAGDIGDNDSNRSSIDIYRTAEPAVYGRQVSAPVTRTLQGTTRIRLNYPDQAHNAEAMFLDPTLGDLYLMTKGGTSTMYKATAAQLAAGGTQTLSLVENVAFQSPSAADISLTGREIILRNETTARMWNRLPSDTVAQAMARPFTTVPIVGTPTEANGEALGFDANGNGYYTTSEEVGSPVHYFARTDAGANPIPTTLLAAGSAWRYNDTGANLGTAWRQPGFVDSGWSQGSGQFGYGDGDEFATLGFGSNPNAKFITSYFRTTFNVADPNALGSLILKLVSDDGAAVYLNGTELLRKNLVAGAAFDTLASSIDASLEDAWFTYSLPDDLLVQGINTLAVEVHQDAGNSSDLSFDLQLLGVAAVPEPGTMILALSALAALPLVRLRRRFL